jgi:hypothetical protein
MKLLFKPFSIIAGIVAARIGKAIFRGLWSRFDSSEPPSPTAPDTSSVKVVGAAALEAATMATVAAAADRAAARIFYRLTGMWPGDKPVGEQNEKS